MDIANITSTSLRGLLKLTETRDALLAEIKKVESIIAGAFVGAKAATPGKRRGRKPGKKAKVVKVAKAVKAPKAANATKAKGSKKSGRRGALKEKILAALKEAGAKGASVKDISSKLGVKSPNVHVWFATTGKKSGIVKVSPGVYRLK